MVKKIKNDRNRKNGQNAKIAKIGKNNWRHLGRYKNRIWSRKNVLNSSDWALSMAGLKWFARVQKNVKKDHFVFAFRPPWRHDVVDSPNFNVLVSQKASKAQISSPKIDFCSKFHQKHFFQYIDHFLAFLNSGFYFFRFCNFFQFLRFQFFWVFFKNNMIN